MKRGMSPLYHRIISRRLKLWPASLAWAYYSEQDGQAINVYMLKAMRVLENFSGEQLVAKKDLNSGIVSMRQLTEGLDQQIDTQAEIIADYKQ